MTPDAAPLSEASLAAAPLAPVPTGPVALPKLGNILCYLSGDSALPYNLAANVFSPERQAQWGDTVVLHLPGSGGGADTMEVRGTCTQQPQAYALCIVGRASLLSPIHSLLMRPCSPRSQEALPGLLDYAVTTCDPKVVAEMLERQDTFPKLWSREAVERKLAEFAGASWQRGASAVWHHIVRMLLLTSGASFAASLGNGLFTSSTRDHDWENAHGLLPRAFNQIRIKNYFPVRRQLQPPTRQLGLPAASHPAACCMHAAGDAGQDALVCRRLVRLLQRQAAERRQRLADLHDGRCSRQGSDGRGAQAKRRSSCMHCLRSRLARPQLSTC